MFKKLRFHTPHYFSKHPSRGMRSLYWSVGLKDLGIAAVTLFEPIFLYSLGYALQEVILYYLLMYAAYFILLPILGRIVGLLGYEHSILYGQLLLIVYFVMLYSISSFAWLFFITPLVGALYKSFYWPAYHADFAIFSRQGQRGREVGYVETLSMVVYIVGPLIGGVILEWTGFGVLFIFGAVLFILAALPLLAVRELYPKVRLPYGAIFERMFDRKHRRNLFAYLGFGEEMIVLTVWPIFIYIVVVDFIEIGALAAAATLITSIIVLYLGKITDRYSRDRIIQWGTALYSLTWFVRGFVKNAWQVMALDAGSRITKETLFIPLEAATYNTARKCGPLVHAIFFEMSLALGKILAAGAAFLIAVYMDDPWVPIFILAGGFSLLYVFFRQKISCD